MKKTLSILLMMSIILTMSACRGKEIDKQAIIEEYLAEQANPAEPLETDSDSSSEDATEPEVTAYSLTMEEFLYHEGDEPLVFYHGLSPDKDSIPESFWLFLNGKVKILPNVLLYTFKDISQMEDSEIIRTTEETIETEFQAYIDGYDVQIQKCLDGECHLSDNEVSCYEAFYLKTGDESYLVDEPYGVGFLDSNIDSLNSAINLIMEENEFGYDKRYQISQFLFFRPTAYHIPDYIDYTYCVTTDSSGNNISSACLVVDNECYFDGFYELLVQPSTVWKDDPIVINQYELPGITASSYALHNADSLSNPYYLNSNHYPDKEIMNCFGGMWFTPQNSMTLGTAPELATNYCYSNTFSLFLPGEERTVLNTTFYTVDGFSTKNPDFSTFVPDPRFCKENPRVTSGYVVGEVPVDYSLDGDLYLIDPEPSDICQYFNSLK